MKEPAPIFPPLLSGHKLTEGKDPVIWAKAQVTKGKLAAGDFVWVEGAKFLKFALVLEPEVSREHCGEMLYVGMVAFGDAAGALIPPEISVEYQWPSIILMNNAQIGFADLSLSQEDTDGIPNWLVLGMEVHIRPDELMQDPGLTVNVTSMWEEGCGGLTAERLLESTARNLVNAIHTWSEDGFKSAHQQWSGRQYDKIPMASAFWNEGEEPDVFVGMDEVGNALISKADETREIATLDALKTLRNLRNKTK
ncbi:MAG: biotin/lipoate--protein ligase family protein [Rhizobiaceae bacterium]